MAKKVVDEIRSVQKDGGRVVYRFDVILATTTETSKVMMMPSSLQKNPITSTCWHETRHYLWSVAVALLATGMFVLALLAQN